MRERDPNWVWKQIEAAKRDLAELPEWARKACHFAGYREPSEAQRNLEDAAALRARENLRRLGSEYAKAERQVEADHAKALESLRRESPIAAAIRKGE